MIKSAVEGSLFSMYSCGPKSYPVMKSGKTDKVLNLRRQLKKNKKQKKTKHGHSFGLQPNYISLKKSDWMPDLVFLYVQLLNIFL